MPDTERKIYGVIYKITNQINGKLYVGQTIRTLEDRFKAHSVEKCCRYLNRSIRKYGKENFKIEQIDNAFSKLELDEKEIFWIKTLDTMRPNGYNLKEGGQGGGKWPDEMKKNHSAVFKILHSDGILKTQQTNILRLCKPNYPNQSSQFKGVHWDTQTGKWMSKLVLKQKAVHRKRFNNEIEAAESYDDAVMRIITSGYLNFPERYNQ